MTWDEIRTKRDELLKQSDWTQLEDVKNVIDYISWQIYRQQLRDLPNNYENPEDVVFPETPKE